MSPEQIHFLLRLRFSVPEIARLLNVSVRTVRRRMDSRGIRVRRMFTQISNSRLDNLVHSLVAQHPNAGYRMMQAYLCSQGIRVPEPSVRASLRRVDPEGILRRLNHHRCINRRVYSVPHPNALWHIHGNMALIRWGFTVHGGIDGYSRLITYLHCSTDNTASTVLQHFCNGISTYGCPSRVR